MRRKYIPFGRVMDELEQKYLHFDGGSQTYYDYVEGEPDETDRLYQADPYQIVVENTDEVKALKAVLFSNNKYLLTAGFGSESGISITIGQPGVDYVELLQQSATTPFSTQFIRVESENSTQLTRLITVNQKDANGNWFRRSLNMQQFKSAYQNQDNMLDAPINEEINGSTFWEIIIEPKTRVFYTIFPLYKIDTSGTLSGNAPVQTFAPAQVNTAGLVLQRAQPQVRPQAQLLRRG